MCHQVTPHNFLINQLTSARSCILGAGYGQPGGLEVGVSKNRGTPKWMVKIIENPIV